MSLLQTTQPGVPLHQQRLSVCKYFRIRIRHTTALTGHCKALTSILRNAGTVICSCCAERQVLVAGINSDSQILHICAHICISPVLLFTVPCISNIDKVMFYVYFPQTKSNVFVVVF